MKIMKKLTALLIALTATLSFATTAACGGNKPSSEESSSETPSTNTAWGEWEAVTQTSLPSTYILKPVKANGNPPHRAETARVHM